MALSKQAQASKAMSLMRAAMREVKQLELVDDELSGYVFDTMQDAYSRLAEHVEAHHTTQQGVTR